MGATDEDFDIDKWASYIGSVLTAGRDEEGNTPTYGQLPQGTMQPHIDYMRGLASQFAGETNIPVSSLGVIHDNPASAEAMYAATEPLIIEAQELNVSAGKALRAIGLLALAISERVPLPTLSTTRIMPRFANPARPSAVSQSDAMVKQAAAAPWLAETSVFLEELGFSEEQIARLRSEKTRLEATARIEARILAMLTRDEYERYRGLLDEVAKNAKKELAGRWSELDLSSYLNAREDLFGVMEGIIETSGAETASLAATFYGHLRAEEIKGNYSALLASFDGQRDLAISLNTQLYQYFGAGGIGKNSSAALAEMQSLLGRFVLNRAGETIALNARAEKRPVKCASVPSLGCKCVFCLSFAAMGFGFYYRESARNCSGVWHDNCRCQLVPDFGGGLDWYKPERYQKLHDYIKDGTIRFQKGANPYEKELDVSIFLADAGHKVKFLTPTISGRTADVTVDGVRRELKIPEGAPGAAVLGSKNIERQFRSAVFPKLQCENLIISHHLISGMMEFDVWTADNVEQWKLWPQIIDLWLIDSHGTIYRKQKLR